MMEDIEQLKKTKVRAVDIAFTAVNDALNVGDLDGAHVALIETLKALGELDEQLWILRNSPVEVGVLR